MQRVALALGLVAAALAAGLLIPGAAHAGYAPSTAPYAQSANDTPLTSLLNVPDTIPASPTPLVPGSSYSAGAVAEEAAEVAARRLPTIGGSLTTIGLAAGAGYLGWKIGTAIYEKFLVGAWTSAGHVTALQWQHSTSIGPFGGPISGSGYRLAAQKDGGTYGSTIGTASTPAFFASDVNAVAAASLPGVTWTPVGLSCGSPCIMRSVSDAGMEATRQPSNAAEYATLPHSASSYTPPTMTAGDLAAARASLGAPVATMDSSHNFADASGNPLTAAQVQAQVDLNCRLDASYCTGGANAPDNSGAVLNPLVTVTMPDCIGALVAVCVAALDSAGHTGTRTFIPGTFAGADATKPADAVISADHTAGAAIPKTDPLTFTLNPDPAEMPLTLPRPGGNETYDDYVARLVDLGWLGSITYVYLDDTNADVQVGPHAVTRIQTTVGTATGTSAIYPAAWPPTATKIKRGAAITLYVNPTSVPPVDGGSTGAPPGAGGTDCPCSVRGIDLSPLLGMDLGSKFPFGAFSWLQQAVGLFDVTPTAPVIDWPMKAPAAGLDTTMHVDLGWWSPYMATMRTLLTFFMWASAIWFVAAKFLRLDWAGQPADGLDEL